MVYKVIKENNFDIHLQRRGMSPSIEKMARIFDFPSTKRPNILMWCYNNRKGIPSTAQGIKI